MTTVGVIGGGAWGTALAETTQRTGHPTLVWAREPEVVAEINSRHTNSLFLPGVPLDTRLTATGTLADVAGREIVLMSAPAQYVRSVAGEIASRLPAATPIVICSKGLERATGKLMSQVLAETLPAATPAVLSGPSFAADVARGLPAALTIACAEEALGQRLAAILGTRYFRLYWSSDVTGVSLGGAIKNVLAIAAGIVEGKRLGASAHAALVTRGFAELRRFGAALGAKPETPMGLSGLGDLLLTCSSPQSRNMSLGRALGEGRTLSEVLGERRSVAEGVYTAAAVVSVAEKHGIDMPICHAVHAILEGQIAVAAAIDTLLARPFRAEDSVQ